MGRGGLLRMELVGLIGRFGQERECWERKIECRTTMNKERTGKKQHLLMDRCHCLFVNSIKLLQSSTQSRMNIENG